MLQINNSFGNLSDQQPCAGSLPDTGARRDARSYRRSGKAKQVTTVTVSSAVDSTVYTLSIGPSANRPTAVTYTSGVGATTTTIAAGLAAAINADADAGALVFATSSAAVITLTGIMGGVSFVVSESDSNLGTPSTTTSASAAPTIYFGTAFAKNASVTDGCKALAAADATAQVVTIAPTAENTTEYGVTIIGDFDGDGKDEVYSAVYTSDGSATDAEIVDAFVARLNDQLPANSVLAANAADDLTLTAEIAGLPFKVTSYTSGSNAFDPAITTANVLPPLAGIALRAQVVEQNASGVGAYADAIAVSGLTEGRAYVRLDASVSPTAGTRSVWVRMTAGADEVTGAFRAAADSTDCLPLSAWGFKGEWESTAVTGQDFNRIAVLEISRL